MKLNFKRIYKKFGLGLLVGIFGLISIFLLNKPVSAASYDQNEMRQFVRNTLADNHVRGTVVIVKDGHPQQISYGYGYYGRRLGAGNTKVVYPTCSLQKVITGAIVTQLIYDKKFDQNTKISRWYPKMKNASKITVGNLLTHTSGIAATGTEVNRGINYTEAGAINWAANNVNAMSVNEPGQFFYNNTNYILLAGIISKVTGKSYEDNVKQRVIEPLGLKRTFFYPDIPKSKTDAISYTYANGHNYQQASYVKKTQDSQLPGAANIFSAPMDYYRIQLGLTNGKILNQDQFKFLTHLSSKVNTYSGGLYITNDDKLKSAYGNLSGTHFGNWFQMTTDNQNGMIMFLNQTQNNEDTNKAIGYKILEHIKAGTFTAK